MQSRKLGLALAALAVAAAVALFVVLREDDSSSGGSTASAPAQTNAANHPEPDEGGGRGSDRQPNEANVPTIVVRNGEPIVGVKELPSRRGEVIRLTVESDVADEVHLHGYDVSKGVEAGGGVRFDARRRSRVCSRSSWKSG